MKLPITVKEIPTRVMPLTIEMVKRYEANMVQVMINRESFYYNKN